MYHKKRVIKTIIIIISFLTISTFIAFNTHKIITKHLENQKEIDRKQEEDKNKKKEESSSIPKEETSKNPEQEKVSNKENTTKTEKKATSKSSSQKKEIKTPDAPDISKINSVTKKENVGATINSKQQAQTNATPIEKADELATITFKGSEFDEDIYAIVDTTIVGEFSISDLYIRKLTFTFIIDYSQTFQPFDNEDRKALEQEWKEVLQKEYSNFTISTSSSGNVIKVTLSSDYDRLKKSQPEEFTENGFYYYNNFLEEMKKMADQ